MHELLNEWMKNIHLFYFIYILLFYPEGGANRWKMQWPVNNTIKAIKSRHNNHKHLSDLVHTQAGNWLSPSAVLSAASHTVSVQESRDYMLTLLQATSNTSSKPTSSRNIPIWEVFRHSLSLFQSKNRSSVTHLPWNFYRMSIRKAL